MLKDFPLIHGPQRRADAFHLATLSDGGLFNFDTSSRLTQLEFEGAIGGISGLIRTWYEIPECREFLDALHAGFVVNSEANAFSQSAASLNVIGMHTGLVWVINEMWSALLGHNDFLPGVEHNTPFDRPEIESRILSGIFTADGFIEDLGHQMRWRGHPWKQLSDSRFQIALTLSAMSIEFVFYHEIAHLLLGHSRYIASKTGASFHELERRRRDIPVPRIELQGLELEADGVATSIALGSGAMLRHFADEKVRDPDWLLSFYFLWGLSVEGVFRLFSQSTWDLNAYPVSTHPHPFVRSFGNWLNVIGDSSLGRHPLRDKILNEYAKAATDLARYWHQFKMPGHEHDPIHTPDRWRTHEGNRVALDLMARAARAVNDTRDERANFELQDVQSGMAFGSGVLVSLIEAEYPEWFQAS